MINQFQSVSPLNPIGDVTQITTLTASVSVVLPDGAKGIMVQPFAQAVNFRTGRGTVTAVTTDFMLIVADGFRFIPLEGGNTIAFIENAVGGTLTYQFFA